MLERYNYHEIYVVKKTENVPSLLIPIRQWSHGTWVHDGQFQYVFNQF